jgi:hypothetical protein
VSYVSPEDAEQGCDEAGGVQVERPVWGEEVMSKKHSVNVSFEEEDYNALRALADKEDRTINGQARHMLRDALHPEMPPAAHQNPTEATSKTLPG